MDCHTTMERVARRAKENCTKDSDFNPSVVSGNVLADTVIGVGKSTTKKPNFGLSRVREEQSISGPVAKRHSRMDEHVREMIRSQPAQG